MTEAEAIIILDNFAAVHNLSIDIELDTDDGMMAPYYGTGEKYLMVDYQDREGSFVAFDYFYLTNVVRRFESDSEELKELVKTRLFPALDEEHILPITERNQP